MDFLELTRDQLLSPPFSRVGLLVSYWPDGSQSLGVGTIVGPNDVLTASQLVFDPNKGGEAKKFNMYFGADFNSVLNKFDSSEFSGKLIDGFTWRVNSNSGAVWRTTWTQQSNRQFTYDNAANDFAVIGLSVPIGNQLGWLDLDFNRDYGQYAKQVGYDYGLTGLMLNRIEVARSTWGVYYTNRNGTWVLEDGSSGGPLLTDDNKVIGVKSYVTDKGSAVWGDIGAYQSKILEWISGNDDLLGAGSVSIPVVPTYSLSASVSSVSEGQSAAFTLSTTNVAAGISVAYTISGVSSADIVGGSLSGSVTVGSNGQATISVSVAADNLTEGNETLTVTAQGRSASVTVIDSSQADTTPPTLSIFRFPSSLSANQTALLTFALSEVSTNFTASDVAVSGGTLSNFSGSGDFYAATFTPTANSTTPGVVSVASGVFTDAAGNANADGSDANNRVTITVNTVNTQSTLSPGASVYDEGQSALFSLTSTGGLAGSSVSYTVSGVTAADLTNGALTGSVVLGADGRATISIPIAADRLTEGNETLTVSVGGVSASTTIRDTSTAQPSSVSVAASGATKSYSVAFTQASVRSSDGGATWTVTTPSGVETLAAPDRLRFSDKTIALDFDRGEAGHKTVTMIGAAFGKGFINQYFGTGVSLFDSGQSMAQIAQLVVSTGLIESMVGSSNSAWVRHVYKNVTGTNPDAFTEAVYRTYLDNGTYTKAGLLELAAGVSALETQIDLVGIRAEGIGYIPFI
jgi:hypothetical protein